MEPLPQHAFVLADYLMHQEGACKAALGRREEQLPGSCRLEREGRGGV